ncbi:hypothetical protein ANHYDRO_01488 [Anaerococcus hydrogenalis DSM 7454]|uniref:Uncharacterized protein n=1 Tax=Anaerococcus hydrogenalis DSM 7454 TaxID=561177 RepID=B6WA61_9FIRM|nr:hypothetical protein ANHYDRO_01488 [Anaerococcus hydrogenalis DSM 7454]
MFFIFTPIFIKSLLYYIKNLNVCNIFLIKIIKIPTKSLDFDN